MTFLPAISFPDPQLAARDLLRSLLAARDDAILAGVTVSTRDIPGSDDSTPLPYVQVRSDGKFRDTRLNGRASIRVLAYHTDEGKSHDLAALCEALLLASSSDTIRGFAPLGGPIPADDPDNGLPFSYFTLTARLKPDQLT